MGKKLEWLHHSSSFDGSVSRKEEHDMFALVILKSVKKKGLVATQGRKGK